jgi:hypothetical protein
MEWLWLVGFFAVLWVFTSAFVSTARGDRPADTIRFDSPAISFGLAFPLFVLLLVGAWMATGGDPVASIRDGDWMTRIATGLFSLVILLAFVGAVQNWSWRVSFSQEGVSQWQYGREQLFAAWSTIESAEARNEALVIHLEDGRSIPLIYEQSWIRLVRSWFIDMGKPFYEGGQRRVTKTLDA